MHCTRAFGENVLQMPICKRPCDRALHRTAILLTRPSPSVRGSPAASRLAPYRCSRRAPCRRSPTCSRRGQSPAPRRSPGSPASASSTRSTRRRRSATAPTLSASTPRSRARSRRWSSSASRRVRARDRSRRSPSHSYGRAPPVEPCLCTYISSCRRTSPICRRARLRCVWRGSGLPVCVEGQAQGRVEVWQVGRHLHAARGQGR